MGNDFQMPIVNPIESSDSEESPKTPITHEPEEKTEIKIDPFEDYIRRQRQKNPVEYARMVQDIEQYGNYDSGMHCGVKWEIRRITDHSSHWCGYALYDGELTDEEMERIEEKSHGGLTAYLGFDCAHCYDYTVMHANGEYRDHDYVVGCMKDMCEVISQTAAFVENSR